MRWFALATLGGLVIVMATVLAVLPAEDIPPRISRETTYFTEPVRDDGTVDYVAALESRLGDPIPPEQNALVPIVDAVGPDGLGDRRASAVKKVYAQLGMEPPNLDRRYLTTASAYMDEHCRAEGGGAAPEYSTWEDWLDRTHRQPWRAGEFPCVAGWLEANRQPLGRIKRAAERSGVFAPAISLVRPTAKAWRPKDEDSDAALFALDRPPMRKALRRVSEAVDALVRRATLRLAEGRVDQAIGDIETVYRLGGQVSRIAGIDYVLEGARFYTVAGYALRKLAVNGHLDGDSAEALLAMLRSLPRLESYGDEDLLLSRVRQLRHAWLAHREELIAEVAMLRGVMIDGSLSQFSPDLPVDYNRLMRGINRHHDRVGEAVAVDPGPDRLRKFEQVMEPRYELAKSISDQSESWLGNIQFYACGPAYRRSFFTRSMTAGLPSAISLRRETLRLARLAIFRLTRATLALTAFEAAEGRYPEKLDALVPEYLSEVPADPFTERALRYLREDGGAVVYSIGGNLSDDGGWQSDRNVLAEGDLVARLGSARLGHEAGRG